MRSDLHTYCTIDLRQSPQRRRAMIYQLDEFEIDTQNYRLSNNGAAVNIEPKVFDLLSYLVVNRNKLVSGALEDTRKI